METITIKGEHTATLGSFHTPTMDNGPWQIHDGETLVIEESRPNTWRGGSFFDFRTPKGIAHIHLYRGQYTREES